MTSAYVVRDVAERMRDGFWRVFIVDMEGKVVWDSQAGVVNDN